MFAQCGICFDLIVAHQDLVLLDAQVATDLPINIVRPSIPTSTPVEPTCGEPPMIHEDAAHNLLPVLIGSRRKISVYTCGRLTCL